MLPLRKRGRAVFRAPRGQFSEAASRASYYILYSPATYRLRCKVLMYAYVVILTTLPNIGTLVSVTADSSGMLGPEDLNELDRHLLNYLSGGRMTPAYARERLADEDVGEYSRGYVQQRLARLEEHAHLTNLYDCGLYELVDDPRDTEEDSDAGE